MTFFLDGYPSGVRTQVPSQATRYDQGNRVVVAVVAAVITPEFLFQRLSIIPRLLLSRPGNSDTFIIPPPPPSQRQRATVALWSRAPENCLGCFLPYVSEKLWRYGRARPNIFEGVFFALVIVGLFLYLM